MPLRNRSIGPGQSSVTRRQDVTWRPCTHASIYAIFIAPHVLQLREAPVDYQMFRDECLENTTRVATATMCT
ncbi:MAG: hypothetical protein K0R53_2666 [Burkholderiales bacterium]|jgi:hypothetical protein|nr:hypothetical protein [Burkholderiales bacterium]